MEAKDIETVFRTFRGANWSWDYDTFCARLQLPKDRYSEEKYIAFGKAARELSNLVGLDVEIVRVRMAENDAKEE